MRTRAGPDAMTDAAPILGNGLGTLADPGALIVRINPQIPACRLSWDASYERSNPRGLQECLND